MWLFDGMFHVTMWLYMSDVYVCVWCVCVCGVYVCGVCVCGVCVGCVCVCGVCVCVWCVCVTSVTSVVKLPATANPQAQLALTFKGVFTDKENA